MVLTLKQKKKISLRSQLVKQVLKKYLNDIDYKSTTFSLDEQSLQKFFKDLFSFNHNCSLILTKGGAKGTIQFDDEFGTTRNLEYEYLHNQ